MTSGPRSTVACPSVIAVGPFLNGATATATGTGCRFLSTPGRSFCSRTGSLLRVNVRPCTDLIV
ncbi:MAG TPA: hypothetical protein VGG16_29630 [Streptosporangiaceae bacterium]|jgi:hypothetical protein